MALTRFRPGSLRELWALSFPLMLSSLSIMAMLFVDRLLLAHYSQVAFNAAVSASTLGWGLVLGWLVLTSITEVFVAQMHGRKEEGSLGEPVWQMIWLSLASIFFFLPLAQCGGCWFYGKGLDTDLQRDYLGWMLLFGPSYPLYGALSGFFVGQGKVQIITILTIVANFINAGLDVVLIFGIEGWVPSLGVKGAAIATSGSQIFQALILAALFLKPSNRLLKGTIKWKIKPKLFWDCIRIGFPGALFSSFEILGWAAFYMMMAHVSVKHITIAGVCQSLVILFYFFGEGINKGITAIVGNRIGENQEHLAHQSVRAGLRLNLVFFIFLIGFFALFSYPLITQLVPERSVTLTQDFLRSLSICLYLVALYIFFEGIRLLLAGALTAAGDTLFLLLCGSLSIWIFLVIPVYYFIVLKQGSIEFAQTVCALYALLACLIYFWRFRSEKWKQISILGS